MLCTVRQVAGFLIIFTSVLISNNVFSQAFILTKAGMKIEEERIASLQASPEHKEVLQCFKELQKKSEPEEFLLELLAYHSDAGLPKCLPNNKQHALKNSSIVHDLYPYFFTKELSYLYLADQSCITKTEGICTLEADPIIHAQDVPREAWEIVNERKIGDVVQLDFKAHYNSVNDAPAKRSIYFVKEDGLWKIKDTVDHDFSLFSTLSKSYKNDLQKVGYKIYK